MNFIKLLARKTVLEFAYFLGIERLFTRFSSPGYLILNYHGIVKDRKLAISKNHLSIDQFEEHLRYFKKCFQVVSLQSMIDLQKKGERPLKPTIAITFDDGYENNFTNAFPLLLKYNFPATIFVTAQALTKKDQPLWYDRVDVCRQHLNWENLKNSQENGILPGYFNPAETISFDIFKRNLKQLEDEKKNAIIRILLPESAEINALSLSDPEYWKLLDESQIYELTQSGLIEIGSHGLTHTNMDLLTPMQLKSELLSSKEILEKASGARVISIAYPDGAYNEAVKEMSIRLGYENLLAVYYRCNSDRTDAKTFPRFSIPNTTTTASVMISIQRAFRTTGF